MRDEKKCPPNTEGSLQAGELGAGTPRTALSAQTCWCHSVSRSRQAAHMTWGLWSPAAGGRSGTGIQAQRVTQAPAFSFRIGLREALGCKAPQLCLEQTPAPCWPVCLGPHHRSSWVFHRPLFLPQGLVDQGRSALAPSGTGLGILCPS